MAKGGLVHGERITSQFALTRRLSRDAEGTPANIHAQIVANGFSPFAQTCGNLPKRVYFLVVPLPKGHGYRHEKNAPSAWISGFDITHRIEDTVWTRVICSAIR